jgi:hypothetical protein
MCCSGWECRKARVLGAAYRGDKEKVLSMQKKYGAAAR